MKKRSSKLIAAVIISSSLNAGAFSFTSYADSDIIQGDFVSSIKINLDKSDNFFKDKTNIFTDMGTHWSDITVGKLVDFEAIKGYKDGEFKPNNTITRAEFSTMLSKIYKLKNIKDKDFSDTKEHWASNSIGSLIEKDIIIIDEYGDKYEPNKNITRIEMAKMIIRAMDFDKKAIEKEGQKTKFYDDKDILAKDKGYIILATENKIIGGYTDNTFKPNKTATRAEASSMLVSMMEVISKQSVVAPPIIVAPNSITKVENFQKLTFKEAGISESVKANINRYQEFSTVNVQNLAKGDVDKFPIQIGNVIIEGIEYNGGFDDGNPSIIIHGKAIKSNDPRDTPIYTTAGLRMSIVGNDGKFVDKGGYFLDGARYDKISSTYKNAPKRSQVSVGDNFSIVYNAEFNKENIKNIVIYEVWETSYEDGLLLDARQMKEN